MNPQIEASFPGACEFTFNQAAFPIVESLDLVNEADKSHDSLVLQLSCEPSFFETRSVRIDSLPAQSTQSLGEVVVELRTEFFLRLPERCKAKVQVSLMSDDGVLAESSHDLTLIPPQPHLSLTYDHSINYAFQQNAIPVVKELHLQNNGIARRDLILRVTTEPAFAPTIEIRLQSIDPGQEFRVSPLELKLSHDFLAELKEKVTGWLKVEMLEGNELVQEITHPINLLAKNEWCGLVALPEILAAFVLPNDPAVMTILGRTSDILQDSTGRSALNGYQDKSRKRAWEQLAAIYKAIGELDIRYINPSASFENTGQKIRFPSDVVSQRFGTCLDLALLFAACCEQAGLRPFVFIHDGHAYAGCWLEERSLPEATGDDLQQVRKLAIDEWITVFETTTVAGGQPGNLNDAELLAKPHLQTEKLFRLSLDVNVARSTKIHPLPVPGQVPIARGPAATVNRENSVSGLGSREFAEEIIVTNDGPGQPVTRIDLWKSRLLDLSLRNRLLNFRETKATIRILSAEPEKVEDELAAEAELALRPRPKLMSEEDPRSAEVFTREQRADGLQEHLREELNIGRLHTYLDENEHARRLTELFRSARNALEENGTNTLFAAVGILEWRETEHSDRVHRAPILLVPVELKRKSVLEGFTLRRIDEETRLNVTLMEMLRQNFQKEIPGLDPLPEDEQGVDVPKVLRIFRDAVRDLVGWEVQTEVWLGQFSFTKFLLWKDLDDRLEDLTKNRVVRHLIHEAGTPIPNPSEDIGPATLDDRFHPRDVLCPRSADSSQLAAVMAAAEGHDFVLEGPPGTGKSQTITNIIAHCLAQGKKVLFVAEKRAALDVVHRRLQEDGLEPFCLELHSNKTGKKEVLEQFDHALKFVEEMQETDWEQRTTELERLRVELNSYARALHRRLPCGLSAYQCLDYLLPRKKEAMVRLDGWPDVLETTVEALDHGRQISRDLQNRSRALGVLAGHPLTPLECAAWSPAWAERSIELNARLGDSCRSTIKSTRELLDWMKVSRPLTRQGLLLLDGIVDSLLAPEPVGAAFATTPWAELSVDLETWISWAKERTELRAALAPLYTSPAADAMTVPCENAPQHVAEALYQKGRELEILRKEATGASIEILSWLQAPEVHASRDQLRNLADLAEILQSSEEVGAAFATTSWETWSAHFDYWISLVQERVDVRARLDRYSGAKLLDLDLDLLNRKWEKANSAWILPKILNLRFVKNELCKALPEKVRPHPDEMGEIILAGIRLREINAELGDAHSSAEALLANSWNEGEPDAEQLVRIREWGERLNQRLRSVVGENEEWLEKIQEVLAGCFEDGPTSVQRGTPDGDRLALMSESFNSFDSVSESFTTEAGLNWGPLDEASDHLSAVFAALELFLRAAPRLLEINAGFTSAAPTARACLGGLWAKGEPDAGVLEESRVWGAALHSRILSFADEDFGWLGTFRQLLSGLFSEGPSAYNSSTTTGKRLNLFKEQWTAYNQLLDDFAQEVRLDREPLETASDFLAATLSLTEDVSRGWPKIREWCSWQKARHEAVSLGLESVVEMLESTDGNSLEATNLFERSFRRALLFELMENEAVLRDFFGNEHNERIERFRNLDERLATLSRDLIQARLASGIPQDHGDDDIPKSEIGLLRKEIGKRMRHIPVRQLLGRIPTLLPRLKPCVLMSPLSVAQYLEPSHETFDVVIFDEASQIPVWDSVGAIARGRQLIVVGDPKQLPPTSFFSANTDDDEFTPEEHKDLESILDELMTHGLRHKRLNWHYRSRHEGLITFSNRQYYENVLLTFPSPEMELGGVRFRHLPEARYDKGKSRTNRVEAEALVKELVSRLLNEKDSRRSYGVVTFSQAQQALVENLLDEERRKCPEIEYHFGDEPPVESEPVFVKNLENVQGDERDVIFFSICYGMDEAGKISMNFGPLNRDGGERRLNVAVTRAKHEVLVFSGLRGDQIDLTRTRSRGVRDLKFFLDYAERGPRALVAANTVSGSSEADSEFERMVADRIRNAGYDVHHQVGCSGYRIDLAVVDPVAPGRYLLGVECDGATYHRAATARDRDKLRQAVLEGLGWELHRIWSTDWWHDPDGQMATLLQKLGQRREASESEAAGIEEDKSGEIDSRRDG